MRVLETVCLVPARAQRSVRRIQAHSRLHEWRMHSSSQHALQQRLLLAKCCARRTVSMNALRQWLAATRLWETKHKRTLSLAIRANRATHNRRLRPEIDAWKTWLKFLHSQHVTMWNLHRALVHRRCAAIFQGWHAWHFHIHHHASARSRLIRALEGSPPHYTDVLSTPEFRDEAPGLYSYDGASPTLVQHSTEGVQKFDIDRLLDRIVELQQLLVDPSSSSTEQYLSSLSAKIIAR